VAASAPQRGWRWGRRIILFAVVVIFTVTLVDAVTRIAPPAVPAFAERAATCDGETTRIGASYLARRGRLWVMQIAGGPIDLGYQYPTTPEAWIDGSGVAR
jgi:hypothetical protein